MPQYMLLLRDDPDARGFKYGASEMQKAFEKYRDWRNKPFVVDGRRLDEQSGRVLVKQESRVSVTDGPYSESREVMGGYYSIEADSFDHAVELALDHPHLDFGTVEIREMVASAS